MRRKKVPNSGPLAPPTVETRVIPTLLNKRAGGSSGRVSSSAATAAFIPRSMFDAVVGVADRGVELGQVVPVLGDECGEARVPTRRGPPWSRGQPLRQIPHLSAGVRTGASQSESSSSSTLSRVTDVPAISSEVM